MNNSNSNQTSSSLENSSKTQQASNNFINKNINNVLNQNQEERQILPVNFWTSILQLEKDIKKKDTNISFDKIQELIGYYRQALEYFDDNEDDKQFAHYKKKLQDLHSYQNVLEVLANQPTEPKKKHKVSSQQQLNNTLHSIPTMNTQYNTTHTQNSDDQNNYNGNLSNNPNQSMIINSNFLLKNTSEKLSERLSERLKQKQKSSIVKPLADEDIKKFMTKQEEKLNQSSIILESDLQIQERQLKERLLKRQQKKKEKQEKQEQLEQSQLIGQWPSTPSQLNTSNPHILQNILSERGTESQKDQPLTPGMSSVRSGSSNNTEPDYVEKFIKLFVQNQKNDLQQQKKQEIDNALQDYENQKNAVINNIKNSNEKILKKLIDKVEKQRDKKIQEIEQKWADITQKKILEYEQTLEKTKTELFQSEKENEFYSPIKQPKLFTSSNLLNFKQKQLQNKQEDQIENSDQVLNQLNENNDDKISNNISRFQKQQLNDSKRIQELEDEQNDSKNNLSNSQFCSQINKTETDNIMKSITISDTKEQE